MARPLLAALHHPPLRVPRCCLLASALILALTTAGCDSDSDPIEDERVAKVGPEGGVLRVRGGVLNIPAGALRESTEITFRVSELGAPEVPDRVRVTKSFHLSPRSLRFLTFATLTLDILPARLPDTGTALQASQFDLRRADVLSDVQERLNGVSADLEQRRVSGEVLQLGVFWSTVPAAPRPAFVSVSPQERVLDVGDTFQLDVEIRDQASVAMAIDAVGLSFSSDDAAVASVDGSGLVTALGPGLAHLTVRAGAAQATARVKVRSGAAIPTVFEWENPLPQGNSLTAITRDQSGALYVAATGGNIWKRAPGGVFERIHQVPDARFAAMSAIGSRLVAVGSSGANGLLLTLDEGEAGGEMSARTLSVTGSTLRRLSLDETGTRGVAVGSGGHLLVFDAALDAWRVEPNPSFDGLLAGGFAGDALRVLTRTGLIYERAASMEAGWSRLLADGAPEAQLIDAVDLRDGAFAAIDAMNRLWRFDDALGWREVQIDDGQRDDVEPESPSTLSLQAIFRMGERVMLRAMETPTTAPSLERELVLLERTTASEESTFERLALPVGATTALWASSEVNLAAVGAAGVIHFWNGSAWTALSSGETGWIIALRAFEAGRVYALVERCLDASCTLVENRLLSRTAEGAFTDITPPDGFWGRMRAMGGRSADDLWVMGDTNLAHHWRDAAWTLVELPTTGIFAIERCGQDLFAAGQNGLVMRENQEQQDQDDEESAAGAWSISVTTGSAALRGLSCAGEAMFAVGDNQVIAWVHGNPVQLSPNDDLIRTAYWKTVFGTPEGRAFIGGNARYILLWNGTHFDYFDNPAGLLVYNVRALFGTGYTDVWAAGTLVTGEGFLAHFDGAEWRQLDAGMVPPILAIDGLDDGTIWFGGGNGSILRGDPSAPSE
ncbi:MAG: Ig-like domain-containing protein [Myxococcales bacterium]|jgi:hypothetical protein|nr:Ig-like domain-containing protein [Myxococcales bacterium]